MMATNRPSNWEYLLSKSPKGSVLMGGAIRDWVLMEEAKDYDIFYPYIPGIPEIEGWKYLPRDPEQVAKWDEDYQVDLNGVHENSISCVYDYDVPLPLDQVARVQLIGVNLANPKDYFKHFDHTLTLGAYSDKGMFVDRRMLESIRMSTVTLLNKKNPVKSLLRAKKVIERIDPMGAPLWTYLDF